MPETRSMPAFGNAPVARAVVPALEEGVGKVANIGWANWLEKAFAPLNRVKFNLGGMSLEDWAGRFLTVFGVYIPQGWISLKNNKHKWETNGRNILVWTMTLAVQMLSKHKKYGVNAIVDKFMQPPAEGQKANALIQKLRLKGNYFDLLERAGLAVAESDKQSAFWSTLDKNQLDIVETYRRNMAKLSVDEFKGFAEKYPEVKKLVAEVGEATGKTGEDLMKAAHEKFIPAEGKFLKKVVNRITAAKFLSTGIITVATMYLIGNLAMEIIFRTVARFDHDFDPEKMKKDKAKKKAIKAARKAKKHGESPQQTPQLAQLAQPLPSDAMAAMPPDALASNTTNALPPDIQPPASAPPPQLPAPEFPPAMPAPAPAAFTPAPFAPPAPVPVAFPQVPAAPPVPFVPQPFPLPPGNVTAFPPAPFPVGGGPAQW